MSSVLMVDDNAAMREAMARSLTRRGCRVTTAASGVEGLEALQQRSFDVVITDLNMPERGGLWLWRQALILHPELRGRFVLIASEPLPEPRSLSLFMETERQAARLGQRLRRDRKSTRLNSSHLVISYAVFCLKKKKNT